MKREYFKMKAVHWLAIAGLALAVSGGAHAGKKKRLKKGALRGTPRLVKKAPGAKAGSKGRAAASADIKKKMAAIRLKQHNAYAEAYAQARYLRAIADATKDKALIKKVEEIEALLIKHPGSPK